MAISALHLTYFGIAAAVGHILGYKRDIDAWTADQLADVQAAIDDGCRNFYAAAGYAQKAGAYEWHFLTPEATITTVSGTDTYDLPDDYASPKGDFVPPVSSGRAALQRVGEGKIRSLKTGSLQTGKPTICTIRPKSASGTAAQTFEVIFYPTPTSEEVISYVYNRVSPHLLREATPYPLGGAACSQAIQAACVACAKEINEGAPALQDAGYLEALRNAVEHDKLMTPDFVGHGAGRDEWMITQPTVTLTVDGTAI